jgi:hypothetical protein
VAFDIEDFKANSMVDGGARPALFEVIIPGWPGSNAISEQTFRFHCRAAQIPPSQLGQVPVPYFGRNIKVIGDRVYADWNVTIMHDENYNLRETMEAWHTSMNQHIANLPSNGVDAQPSSYKRNAVVRHFSKDGTLIKTYTFVGMFPVIVTNMDLAWEATNQWMEFNVDFSIDYWLPGEDDGQQDVSGVEVVRNIVPLA